MILRIKKKLSSFLAWVIYFQMHEWNILFYMKQKILLFYKIISSMPWKAMTSIKAFWFWWLTQYFDIGDWLFSINWEELSSWSTSFRHLISSPMHDWISLFLILFIGFVVRSLRERDVSQIKSNGTYNI